MKSLHMNARKKKSLMKPNDWPILRSSESAKKQ